MGSGGSSVSPFEQVAPSSPGEGGLGVRTSENTEPQGYHAHAHSRGICALGSRARGSAYLPSHPRERARFPAKPIPRAKQGPDGFRQDLQGAPALGIPVLSHTRPLQETWVGAHYSSDQALRVAVTADSLRDLKKKKNQVLVQCQQSGMPGIFWARGHDLPKEPDFYTAKGPEQET